MFHGFMLGGDDGWEVCDWWEGGISWVGGGLLLFWCYVYMHGWSDGLHERGLKGGNV